MVMKLVSRHFAPNEAGSVAVIPTDTEDMWHAYNLVQTGDRVRAATVRKVQTESSTGSTTSNRVKTTLTIEVESAEFDTQACVLRIKGRNVEENEYVKLRAYHTIDVELNRKFTLTKTEWDSISVERLELACDASQSSELAAVIMQEGLAHICLVCPSMTITRQKIEHSIPRKRKGNVQQHEKGINKFFDQIIQGVMRHVNFDVAKCVLLASPGFTKERFRDYFLAWATKNDERKVLDARNKVILVHSSSGFKHALKEVLADPTLQARLVDTKAAGEVRALGTFFEMMNTDADRAVYGLATVEAANEQNAIDMLLVSDALFRSDDVRKRKRYVALVDRAREQGAQTKIFSSLHVSGEQLAQLGGVAAMLRFPMPNLNQDLSDDDNDEVNAEAAAIAKDAAKTASFRGGDDDDADNDAVEYSPHTSTLDESRNSTPSASKASSATTKSVAPSKNGGTVTAPAPSSSSKPQQQAKTKSKKPPPRKLAAAADDDEEDDDDHRQSDSRNYYDIGDDFMA